MPTYIKVDDQKKLFDGAKLGDIITFNPRKAYRKLRPQSGLRWRFIPGPRITSTPYSNVSLPMARPTYWAYPDQQLNHTV